MERAIVHGTVAKKCHAPDSGVKSLGELNRMGADIVADGQHVVIRGVDQLSGCEVDGCGIRAAAALTIAGLRADGETVITNANHIDRGYDGFVGKLASIAAAVRRT